MRLLKSVIIINFIFVNLLASGQNALFDIDKYHGHNVEYWFPNYHDNIDNKKLLVNHDITIENFTNFKCHFYDLNICRNSQSPWNKNFVIKVIHKIKKDDNIIQLPTDEYYRFNKHQFDKNNFIKILTNANYKSLNHIKFNSKNFSIITSNNTYAYVLPLEEPIFKLESITGQGYPFNLNIISNLPRGLPLYILSKSKDRLWSFALTPYSIGWVKSSDIAYVNDNFIRTYQNLVEGGLVSIVDYDNIAFINQNVTNKFINGTILPSTISNNNKYRLYIPYKTSSGCAKIVIAIIDKKYAYKLPYPQTRENMLDIINKLIAKPYGWGGYLNYTDCSLELQIIWQLFGYFTPRNSSQQVLMGDVVDLSTLDATQRLLVLDNMASPFLSMIFVQGHIVLYLGHGYYHNNKVWLVYNNIWGLHNLDNTKKYIIGSSSIMPLLKSYIEEDSILPFIKYKIFKLVQINQNKAYNIDMLDSLHIIVLK